MRIVAQAVARMLRYGGYTVVVCSSAEEALERMDDVESPFDILLSDVEMPGMNGFELAVQARARQPEIGILLMSAHVDPQSVEPPFGATLLKKPFSREQIILSMGRILDST